VHSPSVRDCAILLYAYNAILVCSSSLSRKQNLLLFELQLWYHVSKTLAEKAAWRFAEEEGLQLVVINPGWVLGPTLTPSSGCALQLLLLLLKGWSLHQFATNTTVKSVIF
jgi:nucleoside-diphosphate-sugar epimerase